MSHPGTSEGMSGITEDHSRIKWPTAWLQKRIRANSVEQGLQWKSGSKDGTSSWKSLSGKNLRLGSHEHSGSIRFPGQTQSDEKSVNPCSLEMTSSALSPRRASEGDITNIKSRLHLLFEGWVLSAISAPSLVKLVKSAMQAFGAHD